MEKKDGRKVKDVKMKGERWGMMKKRRVRNEKKITMNQRGGGKWWQRR
jgi:hypothetical protein